MNLDPPGVGYVKPFYLFHYNRPKLPPLKKPKPVKMDGTQQIPIKLNTATKFRNKVIQEYTKRVVDPFIDYVALTQKTIEKITQDPEHIAQATKTSQYRYKIVRDIPVISCSFTEHVMMYKKPPFVFENATKGRGCGRYRLKTVQLQESKPSEEKLEESVGTGGYLGILQ